LVKAYSALPTPLQKKWIWWNLPRPTASIPKFSELIEKELRRVRWHTTEETQKLLSMMSDVNRRKVTEARASGLRTIGTVYKRTRPLKNGVKTQRAEVRFDEISGCLRTPVGGSSRQTVLFVTGKETKSRLLSTREAARLMGVPESYPTPANYNEAYHLFGDGVAVPVVSWLEKHLLRPLALAKSKRRISLDAA
jgi:DNA (cytosine-5)-methyltransferase 1